MSCIKLAAKPLIVPNEAGKTALSSIGPGSGTKSGLTLNLTGTIGR